MSLRCAVCGSESPDVREHETAGGTRYGMACRGECAGLLWEAYFNQATGASEHEHALTLWKWRRRRADVEGRVFLEQLPESPAERAVRIAIAERGWTEISRELT